MRCIDREIVRFVLAGLANTAASYLLYLLLLLFLPYTFSYTLAYVAGLVFSYLLNSLWVFRKPVALKKALRWPFVCAVQYVISVLLLRVAVEIFGVEPRFAPLLAIALTVPVTFLLSRAILREADAGSGHRTHYRQCGIRTEEVHPAPFCHPMPMERGRETQANADANRTGP